MKNKIVIVCGDPNSINSEIIFKTWKLLNKNLKKKIFLIGNHKLISDQFKKLKYKLKIEMVKDLRQNHFNNNLKIINIPLAFNDPFKVSSKNASTYVKKSLDLAHTFAKDQKVKGIINCAINKNLLNPIKKGGVTEYLASKCKISDHSEVMLIHNKKLSVVPLTTHINIKDVSKTININLIIMKIITLIKNYKKLFKKNPKIGILGLNPHNGELKRNSEELTKILPAINKLKKRGIRLDGPLVADTIFINDYKKFDVLVGMYHDQVLGPFKTMYHFDAINITLGLSYIRVSPDHGPALDLVGKNKSKYISLLKCFKFIDNLK